MKYVLPLHEQPVVPVHGSEEYFPVHRIYCVGRNYEAHAREMNKDPERDPPFFFLKPADSVVINDGPVVYPQRTENLHHEIELVVAIGSVAKNISEKEALNFVYGYAVGNDLTRRDLQLDAREKGRPWDTGKAFDKSAPISEIYKRSEVGDINKGKIWLSVNGKLRQEADITDLIWDVPEIIAELSSFYTLMPGDLIYTGTPAGVGPLVPGDRVEGYIEGLGKLVTDILDAEA